MGLTREQKEQILILRQVKHGKLNLGCRRIAKKLGLNLAVVQKFIYRWDKKTNEQKDKSLRKDIYGSHGHESSTERAKRYYTKYPEKRLEHIRRGVEKRLRGFVTAHTLKEWNELKDYYSSMCLYCGAKDRLTRDHVRPISLGGTDHIDNIQPLCHSCNSSKHTKSTDYRPRFEKMRHGIYARIDL